MAQSFNEYSFVENKGFNFAILIRSISKDLFVLIDKTVLENDKVMSHHPDGKSLTLIHQEVLQLLRQNLTPLITMSSGFFKPHIKLATIAAYAHGTGHVLTHLVHCIQILHSVSTAVSITIPIVGLAITHLEHLNEEKLLEKLCHQYHKFSRYSPIEQELIFQFMCSYAMYQFILNLKDKPEKKQAIDTIFNTIHLALLCVEDSPDLKDILKSWRTAISVIFQTKGLTMSAQPKELKRYYAEEELSIAYSIQQIFKRSDKKIKEEFLAVPKMKNFVEDIHRRIVQEALSPFASRAEGTMFSAWYLGYTGTMLDTLKLHHSRLVEAITIINSNFIKVDKETENYKIQMQVINLCLLTALQQYAKALPWHPSSRLFIELIELYPQYAFNPEPIIKSKVKPGHFELLLVRDLYIEGLKKELDDIKMIIDKLEQKQQKLDVGGKTTTSATAAQTGELDSENQQITPLSTMGVFAKTAANEPVVNTPLQVSRM